MKLELYDAQKSFEKVTLYSETTNTRKQKVIQLSSAKFTNYKLCNSNAPSIISNLLPLISN